jgi:hypothetical protein
MTLEMTGRGREAEEDILVVKFDSWSADWTE